MMPFKKRPAQRASSAPPAMQGTSDATAVTQTALKRKADDHGEQGAPRRVKVQESKVEIKEDDQKMEVKEDDDQVKIKDEDIEMDIKAEENIDIKKVLNPILGEYTTAARPSKLVPEKLDIFDLAAETRNAIYELYFGNGQPVAVTSKNPNLVERHYPLLFAAKKVRGETREMFYATKTFLTDDIDITAGYLKALRRPQLKALNDFRIIDPVKIPGPVNIFGSNYVAELKLRAARVQRLKNAAEDACKKAEDVAAMKAEAAAKKLEEAALNTTRKRNRKTKSGRASTVPQRSRVPDGIQAAQIARRISREPRSIRKVRRTLSAFEHSFCRKGLKPGTIKMGMLVHTPVNPAHPAFNIHFAMKAWIEISLNVTKDYKIVKDGGKRFNMPATEEDKKIHHPARQQAELRKSRAAKAKKAKAKVAKANMEKQEVTEWRLGFKQSR